MRDKPWPMMDMYEKLVYFQGLASEMRHYLGMTMHGGAPSPATIESGKNLYVKLEFARNGTMSDLSGPTAGKAGDAVQAADLLPQTMRDLVSEQP